jgi:hypothetical protein
MSGVVLCGISWKIFMRNGQHTVHIGRARTRLTAAHRNELLGVSLPIVRGCWGIILGRSQLKTLHLQITRVFNGTPNIRIGRMCAYKGTNVLHFLQIKTTLLGYFAIGE